MSKNRLSVRSLLLRNIVNFPNKCFNNTFQFPKYKQHMRNEETIGYKI